MKKLFISSSILAFLAIAPATFGAELYFVGGTVNDATQLSIEVRIRSDVAFNAVEGSLALPSHAGEIRGVTTGGSIVALWQEEPRATDGMVRFAGIIPGGYEDGSGLLFTIAVAPKNKNVGITANDLVVLAHDGNGTPLSVAVATSTLAMIESAGGGAEVPLDITPPEVFAPVIVQDPNLFDGQHVLVFSTTDKGAGISHYEVLEFKDGSGETQWQRVTSPYLLQDQTLTSQLYVRAVDRAGNFIIIPVREGEQPAYYSYLSIIIALGVVLLVLWIAKRRMPSFE